MALLYYWRPDNYRRDLDFGAGYHLNQSSPVLHRVELGDSVWAFTRNATGHYVLAAELVVRAKTRNPSGFRYGTYRIWGDLKRSRYFKVDEQNDAEAVLRAVSGRHSTTLLGRAFQGRAAVRNLSPEGHAMLTALARDLPIEHARGCCRRTHWRRRCSWAIRQRSQSSFRGKTPASPENDRSTCIGQAFQRILS